MDVNAAWRELIEAVQEDEWEIASEIAEDILHWLAKQGFPPDITGVETFDRIVAKCVCTAVSNWEV